MDASPDPDVPPTEQPSTPDGPTSEMLDRDVACRFDGKTLGYELLFGGKRRGFRPEWTRKQGVDGRIDVKTNLTWHHTCENSFPHIQS